MEFLCQIEVPTGEHRSQALGVSQARQDCSTCQYVCGPDAADAVVGLPGPGCNIHWHAQEPGQGWAMPGRARLQFVKQELRLEWTMPRWAKAATSTQKIWGCE